MANRLNITDLNAPMSEIYYKARQLGIDPNDMPYMPEKEEYLYNTTR